ncbi:hypothetical protein PUR29_34935 [Methylobacterium ajmalii]|uniref:Uncharacterized protein n=1 Tax=Methylobacterium ajmalii TaxID=2738439 RepID=A0ABV0A468_9HYPH
MSLRTLATAAVTMGLGKAAPQSADDAALPPLQIGVRARDITTGLTGLLTMRALTLDGVIQYTIQPMGDGEKIPEGWTIDEHSLEVVDAGIIAKVTPEATNVSVRLGQEVTDKISGVVGITTRRITYINGCVQFAVQPKVDKDGKMPEAIYLDHGRLVASHQAVEAKPPSTTRPPGGPSTRASSMRIG